MQTAGVVEHSLFLTTTHHRNFQRPFRQIMKLIFGKVPYFDPTRRNMKKKKDKGKIIVNFFFFKITPGICEMISLTFNLVFLRCSVSDSQSWYKGDQTMFSSSYCVLWVCFTS
jgi:hypothetical protein